MAVEDHFCPTCMAVDMLLQSRGINPVASSGISYSQPMFAADKEVKKQVRRGSTTASRKLSKALKEVNKKARKKAGGFKKGWNQKRVMATAHKIARRGR